MRVLGLDTSTLAAGVALTEDTRLIADYFLDSKQSHSRKILPAIDFLLGQTNLKLGDFDCFCVAAGPGSFTGLRIGLSMMKGFGLAVAKPVVGVPTLEAMAASVAHFQGQVCPILDAGKKEVYCALFHLEGGTAKRLTKDMVVKPESLCGLIKEPTLFVGDGVRVYRDVLSGRLGGRALFHEGFNAASVAARVASLGETMLRSGKAPREAAPIYVRPSEAEIKRGLRGSQTPLPLEGNI